MPDNEVPGGPAQGPIEELVGFEEEARPGFILGVRRRIERRSVTSQFLGFAWRVPGVILVQFLDFVFSLFASQDRKGSTK